jgi:hypothetical protein
LNITPGFQNAPFLTFNLRHYRLCDYTQLTLEGLAESHEKEKDEL